MIRFAHLGRYFIAKSLLSKKILNKDIKKIVGVETVNWAKKSFSKQGFTDRSLKKWTPSKSAIYHKTD